MPQSSSSFDPLRRHAPGTPGPARIIWVVLGIVAAPFLWKGAAWIWQGLGQLAEGRSGAGALLLLGGLLCCGVAGLMLLMARSAWIYAKTQLEIAQRLPDEPWLWRKEWATPVLRSSNHAGLVLSWILTLLWVGVTSVSAIYMLWRTLTSGNEFGTLAILGPLIFPVVGIVMLGFVIRRTLRWGKFGDSSFEMQSHPGVLGGELVGLWSAKGIEQAGNGVLVRIACQRQIRTQRGEHSSTEEETLWSDIERVPLQSALRGPDGWSIPIRLALPSDAPPSHAFRSDEQIIWRLEVSAELPGTNYEASIEVPVFQTRETDSEQTMKAIALIRPDARATASAPTESEPPRKRSARDIRLRKETSDGVELDIPPLRWRGTAILLGLIAAFVGLIASVAAEQGAPTLAVTLIWGFTALLTYSALHMLGGSTRLTVNSDGVEIQSRFFGIGPKRRVPAARISDVEVSREMVDGKTTYYQLRLLCGTTAASWSGARGIKAGSRIAGRDRAEDLAARIRSILGL